MLVERSHVMSLRNLTVVACFIAVAITTACLPSCSSREQIAPAARPEKKETRKRRKFFKAAPPVKEAEKSAAKLFATEKHSKPSGEELDKRLENFTTTPKAEAYSMKRMATPARPAAPVRPADSPSGGALDFGAEEEAEEEGNGDQAGVGPRFFGTSIGRPEKKEAAKGGKPQAVKTWKRKGAPTFARVYVGAGNSLELVRMQVNVTVEGPRARTVVDHIFRNPHDRQLEGTFEYPLPTGASPCYYAMFIGGQTAEVPLFFRESEIPGNLTELTPQEIVAHVGKKYWGELKEARIVKKETARKAYEEIVRRKIDPALLEYAGANTFRGRVFPIPAKGYNRVIIAYEQTLERVDEQLRYRFPLPDCELTSLNFALSASSAECKIPQFNTKDIEGAQKDGRLLYAGEWTKQGPGGEAIFSFSPPRKDIQYISGLDGEGGPYYFYAHLRPQLGEEKAAAFAKHAIFLLDISLSEEPDRFNTSVKILAKILESDNTIEKFQVLLFDVGARWLVKPEGFWLANNEEGRKEFFAKLDGVLLEGATDLSAALEKLTAQKEIGGEPVNIFLLSDGQVNWGRTEANQVVARFENNAKFSYRFFCYRTGLRS
jgi:hypothetical protein